MGDLEIKTKSIRLLLIFIFIYLINQMVRKEFIILPIIILGYFVFNAIFTREKINKICLNNSIKFLNAINQQKQGLVIIRNEKNITKYEETLLNLEKQYNEIWKEYLIENELLNFTSGDGEIKYFLKFKNYLNNTECNIITMGVGHSIEAELELKKNYPECTFLSLDPDPEINADLVEKKLKGTFIKGIIGGEDSYSAQLGANILKNVCDLKKL
ncbi:hypothetical protein Mgra_00005557 [Meloidogyne graminicola]|uniref:Uncharacterized protein n=1 Tax=Meloidogyne graminicola TaxID=189291 RepID=A0A8S9ZP87_9BILA|nr:hypothetical protein Mgra_00005557 [Meloidogyne graminicola]